jgi:hypothetical protein
MTTDFKFFRQVCEFIAHEKKSIGITSYPKISVAAFTKCNSDTASNRHSNFASLCLRATALPHARKHISSGSTDTAVYDLLELHIDGDIAAQAFPFIFYYMAYSNACNEYNAVVMPRQLSSRSTTHTFVEWQFFYTHYREHFTGLIDADLIYHMRLYVSFDRRESADALTHIMFLSCLGVNITSN